MVTFGDVLTAGCVILSDPCHRYDLDPKSSGPSQSAGVQPNRAKMGIFRDNVAHSNAEFGLRVWEKYIPDVS